MAFFRSSLTAAALAASASIVSLPAVAQTARPSLDLAPDVRLEVVHVKRLPDKGVTELKLALVNNSQQDTSLQQHDLAFSNRLGMGDLLDFGGGKKYSVGEANGCMCSTFGDNGGGVMR